ARGGVLFDREGGLCHNAESCRAADAARMGPLPSRLRRSPGMTVFMARRVRQACLTAACGDAPTAPAQTRSRAACLQKNQVPGVPLQSARPLARTPPPQKILPET